MFDVMPPLFVGVAWRVGALLAAGAGAILLLTAITATASPRPAASPLADKQTRARASLWPRFWVWVIGTSLLLAGAGAGRFGFGLLLALLSIQAAREVAAALDACRRDVPATSMSPLATTATDVGSAARPAGTMLVAPAMPASTPAPKARDAAQVASVVVSIGTSLVVLSGVFWSAAGLTAGAIGAALAAPLLLIVARRGLGGAAASLVAVAYVALPLAVLVGTLGRPGQPDGFSLVAWLLIVIVLSDTFAMFGGLAFGRRQVAPRLSAGKTIEGVAAGFLGALAGAGVMRFAFPQASAIAYYAAAFAVGVAGLAGDLLASALKRRAGLKDFSRFLPGHGGLMDRLDSILPGVPMLVLLVWLGAFG